MRRSTTQNLASLFRTAGKLTSRRRTPVVAPKKKKRSPSSTSSSSADAEADVKLKNAVSNLNFESSSPSLASAKRLLKQFKAPPSSSTVSNSTNNTSLHAICSDSLSSVGCISDDDNSAEQLSNDASSILQDEMDFDWDDEYESQQHIGGVIDNQWFPIMTNASLSVRRKEPSRGKKQKYFFTSSQTSHFARLTKMCGQKLGSEATLGLFGKLGKANSLKEYNLLIKICIEKARDANDEDVSVEQFFNAYQLFKLVKERGFKIEEETYGQFLMYLIDSGMVEEFFFFSDLIKDDNPDSLPRLAYYEMLLWVRVNNKEKVQQLCHSAVTNDAEEKSIFRECVLMALCESDCREEFLVLLETLDITKVSRVASMKRVFMSLGKFCLEPYAERFLMALKRSDIGAEDISNFIRSYSISIPNLAVEDIIVTFQKLHTNVALLPTSAQYEKLIEYCCEFFKVHEALNVVEDAFGFGIGLSLETFHTILDACGKSCEYNLVHQIKSRISQLNLKPNDETIKKMILLYVKMKDFEGAYELINDLPNMDLKPTAGMFNIILAGYFRERKNQNARNVLKQMKDADVKPNALTYSYLIGNCHCENDVTKFFEDMSNLRIQPTKHVFMALINAYASCGLIENAKKVILNKDIHVKDINLIKSVLIEALAEHGHLSDAIKLYKEIKKAECKLSPKSIRCLIEHFQSEGELHHSLELLEELNDSPHWDDACFAIISHCVQHENLRCTVDLLKQLKDKYMNAEVALEVLFDEAFCLFAEKGSKEMQFGLDLLRAIKEEVGVRPSRKSLDFLLAACVYAKDSNASFAVWKEYEAAGLPYNVLSFVRMYQALLASGDNKSAKKILDKIRQDDPHVRCVIKACQKTYKTKSLSDMRNAKKKIALVATLGVMDALEAKSK